MQTIILTNTLWMLLSLTALTQVSDSGVYLILDIDKQGCPQKLKLRGGSMTFCLAGEAFIKETEYTGISEMYYEPIHKVKVFDINLSKKGSAALRGLTSQFPNARLAIVVDGKVVSAPEADGRVTSGKIKIWEEVDGNELKKIHKQLKRRLLL